VLLDRLPDDCSLDEVLYHLYVLDEVAKGRADAKADRTLTHAEVAKQLRSKWQRSAER
jgi:predicted transcriptional regulator